MAEYVYVPVQTVAVGQNVLLEDSIPCTRGLVFHRNGSGILTLRGIGVGMYIRNSEKIPINSIMVLVCF